MAILRNGNFSSKSPFVWLPFLFAEVAEYHELCGVFIKPSKKWRNPEGDSTIMVPYTYYRLCESYRDADGKVKQRTVLGLGELLDFPTELERKELADLLTEMINDGTFRLCDKPKLYDVAVGFYGKWLEEKKEAQERADKLAEEARRKAEEAKEIKVSIKLKSLHPECPELSGPSMSALIP